MWNRTLSGFCCITLLAAANLLYAQDSIVVVSAAGTQSVVAPGALATVYGQFKAEPAIGTLNTLGLFPTELGGFALDFNGVRAQLLFIGPEQINFLVPAEAAFGNTPLNIAASGAPLRTNATVQPVAPAIFTTIRNGREIGAILNAVTFKADPFTADTPEIPGCDNRTRLAVYATGLGLATSRAKQRDVKVELMDASGTTYSADVDAAVAAPGFAGLDQVNFTLPSALRPGTVLLRIVVNGVPSNQVQFDLAARTAAPANGSCLGNVSIARASAQSGSPFMGTVTLAYPAPAGGATVFLLTDDGVSVPASVNVPAGESSASFPISAAAANSFRVAAALNGNSRIGAFDGRQACVNGIALSSEGIVSGMGLKGSVMLTDPAPAEGVHVNLVSNQSSVSVSSTVTVPQGQTLAPFDITTAQSLIPAKAILTAVGRCGGTSTPLNVVLTPCISSVSLSSSAMSGGGKLTGTVKLNAPALAGGVLVNLSTNDPSLQPDTSVRVDEGQTTATFSVNANAVSARTLASVIASVGTCGSASTTVTLSPR